ncbi:MAG: permease-like cell division protein FtsX [Candidatus Daviesbacteria bacterium]|nr:permease-like cell division protein FtsX [Candidatus Daviesbacteria bacterium]
MSRAIEFTKRNIRRTPFQAIAASMVMLLTFLALQTFIILAAGSQAALRYFESKPQVIAFFKEGTTDQDVTAIENALKQETRVTNTKFVSKDMALQIYREKNKNDPTLLELVTANILPASLEISTKDPEDLAPIADILKREPVVSEVIVPEDVVATLTSITRIIRYIGGATVGFLMIFATLVIVMIIGFKIRIKRTEIEIMRLVGASPGFIRTPFIFEGMLYGVTGTILAWIISYTLLWYFTPFLQGYLGEIKLLPVNPLFMLALLGGSLIAACVVGAIGSFAAVRRYLKI